VWLEDKPLHLLTNILYVSVCNLEISVFIFLFSTFFRLEAVQLIFVVVGACMGALGLMILFVGCLATGATRHKVYRAWRARVGGRISCAVVCSDFVLYTENFSEYRYVKIM
jgi:hypothetical protein